VQETDPQDTAEALDSDKVDPDHPPEEPMGVDEAEVTDIGEDASESFAERTAREHVPVPDEARPVVQPYHDGAEDVLDEEAELVADAEIDGRDPEADGMPEPAEEAALRLAGDPRRG